MKSIVTSLLLSALLSGAAVAQGPSPTESEPAVVEVKMVDKGPTQFAFEPADIRVRPGDRVVWIQEGIMPHNVEFTGGPGDFGVEALPMSPYLTTKGQRYELRIDGRFEEGKYEYLCTPHAAMGMTGTITVVSRGGK